MRDIEAQKRDAEFQARQEALAALKESNDRAWERSGNGNDRPGYRDALISALSAWARTVFEELAHNLTHEATDRKEYRRKLTDAKKRILAEIFPVRRARSSRPGKLVRPLHREEIEVVGCGAPECEVRSDDDGLVLTPDGAFEPSRRVRQWEEDIGLWEVYCKDPALVAGFKFDRLQKRPRGAPERPFDRAHRLISNALEGRILHWQTQFRDSPDAQSRAETDKKPAGADLGRDRQAVRSLVDWRNQASLSQKELAEKAGIDESIVKRAEMGVSRLSFRSRICIAGTLSKELRFEVRPPQIADRKRVPSSPEKAPKKPRKSR